MSFLLLQFPFEIYEAFNVLTIGSEPHMRFLYGKQYDESWTDGNEKHLSNPQSSVIVNSVFVLSNETSLCV